MPAPSVIVSQVRTFVYWPMISSLSTLQQLAQSSRDRKKMEYANLQVRVAQLEAENAALRARTPVATSVTRDAQLEERDRENAQLRERYKSPSITHSRNVKANLSFPQRITVLEKAWENVASVLQSLGAAHLNLGSALSAPPAASPVFSVSNDFPALSATPSASPLPPPSPPITTPAASTPSSTEDQQDPTRHLARVATVPASARTSLQRVGSLASTLTTASCALPVRRLPIPPRTARPGSTLCSRPKTPYCRERWVTVVPSRFRRRRR